MPSSWAESAAEEAARIAAPQKAWVACGKARELFRRFFFRLKHVKHGEARSARPDWMRVEVAHLKTSYDSNRSLDLPRGPRAWASVCCLNILFTDSRNPEQSVSRAYSLSRRGGARGVSPRLTSAPAATTGRASRSERPAGRGEGHTLPSPLGGEGIPFGSQRSSEEPAETRHLRGPCAPNEPLVELDFGGTPDGEGNPGMEGCRRDFQHALPPCRGSASRLLGHER